MLICHSGESIDRRTQSKTEIRNRFLHTLVASKNKKTVSFGVAVCMICVTIMLSCLSLVHDRKWNFKINCKLSTGAEFKVDAQVYFRSI